MYNPLRHPDSGDPWPIPVTPGGPIGARDHVGHLDVYQRLLAAVGRGQVGALCTGDRRQGKTSMLNLIDEVLRGDDDVRVLRISAETSMPEVLRSRLKEQVRQATWLGREAERWALDLDVSYRGFHLRRTGGTKRSDLDDETDDLLVLAARKAAPRRLVVVIDEITVFVEALVQRSLDEGLEFLRALRRARQDGADNLAIVLSGSMGLHHVVPTMQAVNDLVPIRIGRLAEDEARFLGQCLILGGGIDADDAARLAAVMAEATDGGAFYLHHLADELRKQRGLVTPADARRALDRLIEDPDDPLHFRHYRDRLQSYYGREATLAAQVLDAIATNSATAVRTDEVCSVMALATGAPPPRDRVVSILERLEQDHYLEPAGGGTKFASSLQRRAWIVVRRLDR